MYTHIYIYIYIYIRNGERPKRQNGKRGAEQKQASTPNR